VWFIPLVYESVRGRLICVILVNTYHTSTPLLLIMKRCTSPRLLYLPSFYDGSVQISQTKAVKPIGLMKLQCCTRCGGRRPIMRTLMLSV